jgi:hypothetical protein
LKFWSDRQRQFLRSFFQAFRQGETGKGIITPLRLSGNLDEGLDLAGRQTSLPRNKIDDLFNYFIHVLGLGPHGLGVLSAESCVLSNETIQAAGFWLLILHLTPHALTPHGSFMSSPYTSGRRSRRNVQTRRVRSISKRSTVTIMTPSWAPLGSSTSSPSGEAQKLFP